MEHLVSLSAIRAFCRVLELSSFRQAAECLNVPIATLSGRIKTLEQSLGVALLVRGSRGISATAAGERYYAQVGPLLAALDGAARDLHGGPPEQPKGRLHVSVPASVARLILAPSMPEFLARFPDLSLRVLATDNIVDLEARGLDCAVRACEPADDGLAVRPLVRMPQFFAASPLLIAQYGEPQNLSQLSRLPFINYGGKRDELHMTVDARSAGESCQFEAQAPISIDDGSAYVSLASAGLGVVQSPLCDLRPYLSAGTLQLIMPAWRGPDLVFHMVYAQGRNLLPRVRAFGDWVLALLTHPRHHQPGACAPWLASDSAHAPGPQQLKQA